MNVRARLPRQNQGLAFWYAYPGSTGQPVESGHRVLIADQGSHTGLAREQLIARLLEQIESNGRKTNPLAAHGEADRANTEVQDAISAQPLLWLALDAAVGKWLRSLQGGTSPGDKPATETKLLPKPVQVEKTLERLFEAARDEYFEDGMESAFSRGMAALVEAHGDSEELKVLLTGWILRDKTTPYVVSEALRCLGRLGHPPTKRYRRWILERCLRSRSPIVRDAAALGLASMDDRETVPAIRDAIERETLPELRENLKQVLEDLQG